MCLLYTKRSSQLRKHAREISFPGGLSDDGDGDAVDTALREAEEELGLTADRFEIWGKAKAVSDSRGRVITLFDEGAYATCTFVGSSSVTPVIGVVKDELSPADLRLNPSEVDAVMLVPVARFLEPGVCRYTQFRGREGGPFKAGYTLPVFMVDPYPVWGMTAIMTFQTLKGFLPGYKHAIRFASPVT